MHLSFIDIAVYHAQYSDDHFADSATDIDEKLFYSAPSSFFILDENIPRILRELFAEAEGCLQGNFLTGASACVRKIIYELARIENAQGENYDERIRSLKAIKPNVDSAYFDTMLAIQKTTSDKVHENSYDKWEAKHLKLLLATMREILQEIYVTPKLIEKRRASVLELRDQVFGKKQPKDDQPPKEGSA